MAKSFLLATVLLVVYISLAQAGSIRFKRQAIPRELQNLNIENYFKNANAVRFQLRCVIYDGPCDRIGKYLKITIPDLLTNQCRNCNPEQRKTAGRLVAYIQQNYPTEWDAAVKKFQGGKVISAAEVKKFEAQFGVKVAEVSTEAPLDGETVYTGPSTTSTTTAKVTIEEIGKIVKEAQKEYQQQQQNQPSRTG